MGLIECVIGEGEDLIVDFFGRGGIDAVGHAALNVAGGVAVEERLPLLGHVLGLLLAHGTAEHIRLSQRVPGKLLEDLDDLLLIDDTAIGDGQDRLQLRDDVADLAGVMLAGDELGDRIHGAGTVQGDDGGDVLNALGLQTYADAGHAGGFHLEHTVGFAVGEHFVGLRVPLRDVIQGEVRLPGLHHFHGIVQHRQVPQAQEVHFQQAQLFQCGHDILADHGFVIFRQGYIFVHRLPGDDHAGGVGGGVAGHSLQCPGGVDELFYLLVGLIEVAELLAEPQRVIQGDVQGIWYQLGDDVHIGVGHIQHPAHIPDDAPGGHGAEGDDLGHVVVAVLAADVVHHLAPAGITEVHIDIRHTHPLRVQEPLKVQTVLHGVDIGDAEAVADHGPRRAAAARSHRDAHAFGVAHEVGYDEEIVGKAHFLDHVLLVFQLAPEFVIIAVPGLVALVAQLFQIGKAVIPLRQLEFRQVVLAEGKFKVAHLRDLLGVFQCALVALEQRRHLLLAAEVEVLRLIAHPVFIVHRFSGLDAQQDVVGLGVLLSEIVGVIGADHGDAGLLMDLQNRLIHQLLVPDAVILQF